MKNGLHWGLMMLLSLCLAACGKQSAVEGKLVDWDGQPVAGVKIIATQIQAIKGYEQFETVTQADGMFTLGGLFPSSAYVLKPSSDKWTNETAVTAETAPQGETRVLPSPIVIKQVYTKKNSLLVADIATGNVGRTAIWGRLIDWKNKPVVGVKIVAQQQRPIPGYEQFETVTDSDGSFGFCDLLASSSYVLKPWSEKWNTDASASLNTATHHGGEVVLSSSIKIDLVVSKDGKEIGDLTTGALRFTISSGGVIRDALTGLEWVVGPNQDMSYADAEKWVANCDIAGGGWRMPASATLHALRSRDGRGPSLDPIFQTSKGLLWIYTSSKSSPRKVSSLSISSWSGYEGLETYSSWEHRVFAVRGL